MLPLSGQDTNSLSESDLRNIRVDELSDDQIQIFLDRAKESGLTMDQLVLAAQQKGMSSSQISKLRARIRQLESGSTNEKGELIASPANRLRESYDEEKDQYDFFNVLDTKEEEETDELQIFGLDIFSSSDLTFEPSLNVATPENYILGPGDEIIIDIYGASEATYQQMVSPDGKILIQGVGPIDLAGISIEQARTRLFNKLSNVYAGLKGRKPNTFIQVSVGNVRTIKVNVVGNVVQPGTYTLSSFATVFNALYFAGGPTESGSLREINVIRNGEKIAVFDSYKYLFDGDESQNPTLRDQDVIVVRPYSNRVKLAGNVKQSAIYELNQNESFQDLLDIAGGFNDRAFSESITIDRVNGSQRVVKTIPSVDFSSEMMFDGDSVFVGEIMNEYKNRISIEGAIRRAGYYELTEGLKLSDLIEMAGGLRQDAYKKRGNIIRLNDDFTLSNLAFDLNAVLVGSQDVLLSRDDIVRISSIFELNENKTVSLQGEVRQSGSFPYIQNMTVEDLLNLAGGLNTNAHTASVEIARRIVDNTDLTKTAEIITFSISPDLGISEEASEFRLEPFDLVLIKSTSFNQIQKVVKVEGEVMFPGYYALETIDDRISDVISRAGGLTQYGYAKGATLIRRTEYFRTEYEKEELSALVEKRRKELQEQYKDENLDAGVSKVDLIRQELTDYEKELTENIKKADDSDVLESRIFRGQQLRKLLQRDSISGSGELIEQQGIGIELDKVLTSPNSAKDLILRDGDLISVPRVLQTVKTQGEVLYPNTLGYQDNLSFKRYISLSGGFSDEAKPGKSYIVYANGNAQRTKNFLWFKNFPQVQPGADIIVPKRKVRRKLSVAEVVGIASSLATMGLVIDRLSN